MTPGKTKTKQMVLGPKAVTELFKPARLEIFESLQLCGPASVSELAERLGKAPDSLYYHLRKLVQVGVIEQHAEESGAGLPGRNGAMYEVAALSVTMNLDNQSRPSREAWAKGCASVLRLVTRDVEAALDSRSAVTLGAHRNLLVQRRKARLSRSDLKRVNALLDEAHSILADNAENTSGQLYALTCTLSPLEERTR